MRPSRGGSSSHPRDEASTSAACGGVADGDTMALLEEVEVVSEGFDLPF